MVLPLLRVIFIQPDSPWLWQQSGLWEPDANQAVQMSGTESQENASWGGSTIRVTGPPHWEPCGKGCSPGGWWCLRDMELGSSVTFPTLAPV